MGCDQRFEGRWLVLVDETTEDRSAPDPAVNRLGSRRCRAWRTQLQRSVRPLCGVMRGVRGKHLAKVPLAEDQHAVGEFGANGQYEAFGEAVRPRTPWRDLDHLDARIGQYRVERGRELSGPVAGEEPDRPDVLAEVHDEVAGLLGGPESVGMRGHAEDVQMAVADLECEQDVVPA
jgi:hypothetical protein